MSNRLRLLQIDELSDEQRRELATASRNARPNALAREEFAALVARWRAVRTITPR